MECTDIEELRKKVWETQREMPMPAPLPGPVKFIYQKPNASKCRKRCYCGT